MENVRILVAEDQPDFLELLFIVFSNEGFLVATASDGEMAIGLLNVLRPAAILTDLMMPNVDGLALIKYVREQPELAGIPIIVMSGLRSGSLERAMLAGANLAFNKPIDPYELVRAVKCSLIC